MQSDKFLDISKINYKKYGYVSIKFSDLYEQNLDKHIGNKIFSNLFLTHLIVFTQFIGQLFGHFFTNRKKLLFKVTSIKIFLIYKEAFTKCNFRMNSATQKSFKIRKKMEKPAML